jgi:hypothetical protein
LIIVTTVALFALAGGLMIVISKTWTSHRRVEGFTIHDLVAEDARQQEALADDLEVGIEPRLAG